MLQTNVRHRATYHRARPNDVQEKCYKVFFTPLSLLAPQGDALRQSSSILQLMYGKAQSINMPNFVPFGQRVYEIPAAKLR